MNNLQIDDANLQSIIAKSILDSLSDESREKLIGEAVKSFISVTDKERYGSKKTPLEEAFQWAVADVARKTILDKIESDGVLKGNITAAVSEAIEAAFSSENRENMVEAMTGAVTAAFVVQDRY